MCASAPAGEGLATPELTLFRSAPDELPWNAIAVKKRRGSERYYERSSFHYAILFLLDAFFGASLLGFIFESRTRGVRAQGDCYLYAELTFRVELLGVDSFCLRQQYNVRISIKFE